LVQFEFRQLGNEFSHGIFEQFDLIRPERWKLAIVLNGQYQGKLRAMKTRHQ
jgi:hypothetical protein